MYTITTDKSLLHPEEVHRWLTTASYWSRGIPYEVFKRSFDHSCCAGVLHEGRQVGFGRLITDYATFAYLADVYVAEAHRGQGLGKRIVEALLDQDWIPGLRKILLATQDAHGLYRQFGFTEIAHPERLMERAGMTAYESKRGM